MVSLSLMARLVEAVRPGARLILVGDPGQLTSIEAGAVLGDIAAAGGDAIVVLDEVYRYDEGIGRLAAAIREGDADATVAALAGVTWIDDLEASLEPVRERARGHRPRGHRRGRARRRRRGAGRAAAASGCCARTAAARTASAAGRPGSRSGPAPAAATGTSAGRCW